MAENKNNDGVIGAFYGKGKFVKFKEAWRIGKIKLDFVRTDDNDKAIDSREFFLDAAKAGCLAREICSGTLQRRAEQALWISKKDKTALYTPLFIAQGGTPEDKAKRSDRKALARVFSILPSTSSGCPIAFRLETGSGHSTPQGLIVPDWWGSKGASSAKEFDLIVPANNDSGGVKEYLADGSTKDYLHNGPLDQFGIILEGAINAYYVKGMLDGNLFTTQYTPNGGEGGSANTEDNAGSSGPDYGNASGYDPYDGSYSNPFDEAAPAIPNGHVVFDSPLSVSSNNPKMYAAKVSGQGLNSELVWFNSDKLGQRLDTLIAASQSKTPVQLNIEQKTDAKGKTFYIAV